MADEGGSMFDRIKGAIKDVFSENAISEGPVKRAEIPQDGEITYVHPQLLGTNSSEGLITEPVFCASDWVPTDAGTTAEVRQVPQHPPRWIISDSQPHKIQVQLQCIQ